MFNCSLEVSKFEQQSLYYVHIRTNTFRKVIAPPILSAMGSIVLLLLFYKVDFSIKLPTKFRAGEYYDVPCLLNHLLGPHLFSRLLKTQQRPIKDKKAQKRLKIVSVQPGRRKHEEEDRRKKLVLPFADNVCLATEISWYKNHVLNSTGSQKH